MPEKNIKCYTFYLLCYYLIASVVADVIVLVLLEEVSRRHRVAVRQDALFPQVEGGTLEQGAHQLVRVPSQAVSSLHPGKSARSMGLRHEKTSSPGRVDVQPDVVLLADIGDRVDRIKGSDDCRPRRAVDKEG